MSAADWVDLAIILAFLVLVLIWVVAVLHFSRKAGDGR